MRSQVCAMNSSTRDAERAPIDQPVRNTLKFAGYHTPAFCFTWRAGVKSAR